MKSKLFLIGCFSLVPSITVGGPYDHCAQILSDGKFNTTIVQQSAQNMSYAFNWLCSQEYAESSTTVGQKLNAVWKTIMGGVEYSRHNFNLVKQDYCSQDINVYTATEKSFMYSYIADPDVVKAWRDCVVGKNRGLVCNATPEGNDVFVSVEMGHGPGGDLTSSKLQVANLTPIFPDTVVPTSLKQGDSIMIPYGRTKPNDRSIFLLSGSTNLGATNCMFRIPPLRPLVLPDLVRFRIEDVARPPQALSVAHQRTWKYPRPGGGHCTLWATESLQAGPVSVTKDKRHLHIPYKCVRENTAYDCGGGRAATGNSVYSANLTADIAVQSGQAFFSNVKQSGPDNFDDYIRAVSDCDDLIEQHIRAASGSSVL